MPNKIESWKQTEHPFEVWPRVENYAREKTPVKKLPPEELERMKWYGFLYRKREGTFMVRIRATACELSSLQARTIADLSYSNGHGIVDVTTRGNLQIQGVRLEEVPIVYRELERVGITSRQTGHDNMRNVMCGPLDGNDPEEVIDVRPLCRALTERFLGNRELADLPRKFNIAFSGSPKCFSHLWTQDLSLVADRTREGEVFFQALIGGNQGAHPHLAQPAPIRLEPGQTIGFALATAEVFRRDHSRENRSRCRFAYFLEEIGMDEFLKRIEELTGVSYPRIDPSIRMHSSHPEWIGWMRQRQAGLWSLGVSVPLGRLTWRQLEGASIVAREMGEGILRTSWDQGLVIPGIPDENREEAVYRLAEFGLSHNADSIMRNLIACTGKQFCNQAITESKKIGFQLMDELRRRGVSLQNIRIQISGCPSACANHHTADIGLRGTRVKRRFFGVVDAFDVFLAGSMQGGIRLAKPYAQGVPLHRLAEFIEQLVREFYRKRKQGQSFSAYWGEKIASLETPRKGGMEEPPVWECERCGYRHIGQDPPIFCPKCTSLRRNFFRHEGKDEAEPLPGRPSGVEAGDNPGPRM